jgi:hypothetical protein
VSSSLTFTSTYLDVRGGRASSGTPALSHNLSILFTSVSVAPMRYALRPVAVGRNEATLLAPTRTSTPPLPAMVPRVLSGQTSSSHSGSRRLIDSAHSLRGSVFALGVGNLAIARG